MPGHHQVRALVAALLLTLACGSALAQDAIEIDPEAEEAFFRGVGLLESGDAAAAVAEFELAVTLQPDFRRAYYYRARAAVAMEDWSVAKQSAEAYSRFELTESEIEQLGALIRQIDEGAPALTVDESGDELTPPAPGPLRGDRADRTDSPEAPVREPTRTDEAIAALADGHQLLEDDLCQPALEKAQLALSLDPGLTDALLLKGLALECLEDWPAAFDILRTYQELKGGSDPVAARALERIEQARALSAPVEEAGTAPALMSSALGNDPRIEGVLKDRWGDSAITAQRSRTRHLPGIGRAAMGFGRMELAGSRAEVEVARIHSADGLVFSRLRVWGRSGMDTGGWYARAFAELYLSIVGKAGSPASRSGLPDPRTPSRNSYKALAGKHRWEVTWVDDDGDQLVLRLGRCSTPGNDHPVVAENRPCLELVGSSGSFHPDGKVVFSPGGEAVRLSETPGKRSWDIDVAIGGGLAPGVIISTGTGAGTFGLGQFHLDLLGRFNLGALTVGGGWAPGLGITSTAIDDPPTTWFDSRITAYVGFRDRPRQPQWRSLMLGIGVVPDGKRIYGTGAAALAVSFRLTDQTRRSPVGGFMISIEPTAIIGAGGVLTVLPLRFTLGGVVGTKARMTAPQQVDDARWK
ncbi:MAG: hypothetical protein GY898_11550 [Proteobacteria bacterium]|nr:hypothetical protein [Pseudomonadota bacterium]